MILQYTSRPVEFIDGLGLARAQPKVARTMMPSSMPYILRLPKTSASPVADPVRQAIQRGWAGALLATYNQKAAAL